MLLLLSSVSTVHSISSSSFDTNLCHFFSSSLLDFNHVNILKSYLPISTESLV
jgi:hypothetical protein